MRTWRLDRSHCYGLLLLAALAPAAQAAEEAGPEPAVVTSSAAQGAPAASVTARPPAAPAAAPRVARPAAATPDASAARAQDRIELETTQISGNRELPKVMYVVPWRKPDLGDFSGRPPNSLLDEALAPLDRDVFQRQNRYYASLAAPSGAAGSQPGAPVAPPVPPVAKDEK